MSELRRLSSTRNIPKQSSATDLPESVTTIPQQGGTTAPLKPRRPLQQPQQQQRPKDTPSHPNMSQTKSTHPKDKHGKPSEAEVKFPPTGGSTTSMIDAHISQVVKVVSGTS